MREGAGRSVWVWRTSAAGRGYSEVLSDATLTDQLRCALTDGANRESGVPRGPFADYINPGETVLVKPNLVKEGHPRDPEGWQWVLTHGSVIRAACDLIWEALDGKGRVLVADGPQTDSSFRSIAALLGLEEIAEGYRRRGWDCQLIDLRREEWTSLDDVIVRRETLSGDPNGYVAFDLAQRSEFANHGGEGRYYGADYDQETVNLHHSDGRHEYLISGSAMRADVVFSIPKMKTHKKAGITGALKNLVGINGDKNWLPHHTEGTPADGGDERPECRMFERNLVMRARRVLLRTPLIGNTFHRYARKAALKVFGSTEEVIRSGNWYGNETVWRMCLDLNKVLFYGDPSGALREDKPQNRKRHLVLVDGIIAGEGNGPMNTDPVHSGIVVFGTNAASVDAACAVLMGFDPEKIPIIRQAFLCKHFPLADWDWRDVKLVSNKPEWNGLLPAIPSEATFHFEPHFGWKGHIERRETQ